MVLTKKGFAWDNGYTLFNIVRCQFSSTSNKKTDFKKIIEKDIYSYLNYSNFLKITDQINIEYSLINNFKANKLPFKEYKEIIKKLKKLNYFLFLDEKLILSKGYFNPKPIITIEHIQKYVTPHKPVILIDNTDSNNSLFESIFNYEYLINNYLKDNNINIEISTYFDMPSKTLHVELISEKNISNNQIKFIINLFKNLDNLINTKNIVDLINESKRLYNYYVYDKLNEKLLEKNVLFLLNVEYKDINKISNDNLKTIFINVAKNFKNKKMVVSK